MCVVPEGEAAVEGATARDYRVTVVRVWMRVKDESRNPVEHRFQLRLCHRKVC